MPLPIVRSLRVLPPPQPADAAPSCWLLPASVCVAEVLACSHRCTQTTCSAVCVADTLACRESMLHEVEAKLCPS